jgi:hypothetical protein
LWGDVLFEECVEFSVFFQGEAIEFASLGLEVGFESDLVIPQASSGKSGCGLFVEDHQVLVILYQLLGCSGLGSGPYGGTVFFELLYDKFYEEMMKKKWVVYFQQDGAPSHTSKATKEWCEDHKIKIFPHQPSSPDVDPIEPVWHNIKTMIQHLPHPSSTVNQLDLTIEKLTKYTGTMVVNEHFHKVLC